MLDEDKPRIPLAIQRPMILRARFQPAVGPSGDSLAFSERVNADLRAAADPGPRGDSIVFIDSDDLTGALHLTGRYRTEGQLLRVESYLQDGETVRAHFNVSGSASALGAVARAVVKRAEEAARAGVSP